MIEYHKHWDLKPMEFDPPGDWKVIWFHRLSKGDLHFAEYCFTEYPAPGFYARASEAFRKRMFA